MDAKLIKDKYVNDFYYLMVGINTYATTHKESFKILSLKNCQAIELGYDLDELSRNYGNKDADITNDFGKGHREGCYIGYLAGFQKALSILGNKKFSDEDMRKAIGISKNGSMQEQHNGYGGSAIPRFVLDNLPSDEIIQSLQQTEWDVEVEMEDVFVHSPSLSPNQKSQWEKKPKLDADGCLILKRI